MEVVRDYLGQPILPGTVLAYGRRDGNTSTTSLYVVTEVVSEVKTRGWGEHKTEYVDHQLRVLTLDYWTFRDHQRDPDVEVKIRKTKLQSPQNTIVIPENIDSEEARILYKAWQETYA